MCPPPRPVTPAASHLCSPPGTPMHVAILSSLGFPGSAVPVLETCRTLDCVHTPLPLGQAAADTRAGSSCRASAAPGAERLHFVPVLAAQGLLDTKISNQAPAIYFRGEDPIRRSEGLRRGRGYFPLLTARQSGQYELVIQLLAFGTQYLVHLAP